MRNLLALLLLFSLTLMAAKLEKMPNIPAFAGSILEENVSEFKADFSKEYEWYAYDLSKRVKAELSGELWNLYYRTQSESEAIKELLKEEIVASEGSIVLDIADQLSFFYPDQNNDKMQYLVELTFFGENFRAQILKFNHDQASGVLEGNDAETSETKLFTKNSTPDKLFYFDPKGITFPEKYREDVLAVAEIIKARPEARIYIFGYADPSEGGFTKAGKISKMRMLGVLKALIKEGLKERNIVYIDRGTSQKYDKNEKGNEAWQNMRVELYVKK